MKTEIICGVIVIVFASVASIFDLKTRRIPNLLVLCMPVVWLLLFAAILIKDGDTAGYFLINSLLGVLVGGGVFLAVYFISRRGLGGGDVKFMAAAGLFLGFTGTAPAILYSTVLAALTGAVMIAFKKISRKDKLPLAPFLLAGIVIATLLRGMT